MDTTPAAESGDGRPRTALRRLIVVAVASIVAVLVAAGSADTWASAGARIENQGFTEEDAGVVLSSPVKGAATLTTALVPLCLDDEGSVEILDVTPYQPVQGMRVTDFGLVQPLVIGERTTSGVENRRQPFADALRGREVSRTLTVPCDSDRQAPDLIVELRKPGAEDVEAGGFHMRYRSAGREHRVFTPFGILFCEPRPGQEFCSPV